MSTFGRWIIILLTIFGGVAQAGPLFSKEEEDPSSTATRSKSSITTTTTTLRQTSSRKRRSTTTTASTTEHGGPQLHHDHRHLTFTQITHTSCLLSTEVALDILFKTDLHPHETTEVYLMDELGFRHSIWIGEELQALEELTIGMCLDASLCYRLVVEDAGGDGLCCTNGLGGYQVQYNSSTVATSRADDFEEAVIVLGEEEHCEDVYDDVETR